MPEDIYFVDTPLRFYKIFTLLFFSFGSINNWVKGSYKFSYINKILPNCQITNNNKNPIYFQPQKIYLKIYIFENQNLKTKNKFGKENFLITQK